MLSFNYSLFSSSLNNLKLNIQNNPAVFALGISVLALGIFLKYVSKSQANKPENKMDRVIEQIHDTLVVRRTRDIRITILQQTYGELNYTEIQSAFADKYKLKLIYDRYSGFKLAPVSGNRVITKIVP